MNSDIVIKRIVNVFYMETDNWNRGFTAPRVYDGIVLFCEGEIEYFFPGQNVTARAGDLLFLPGNLPYSGKRKTERVAFYVMDLECEKPDEFEHLPSPTAFTPQYAPTLKNDFENALRQWKRQQIDVCCRMKAFAYFLLAHYFADGSGSSARTDAILSYIASHLDDPSLSNAQLCRTFYVSESQLRRLIVRAAGSTPNDYITRLRLDKAGTLLRTTEDTVSLIASACGFSSPFYFSRCFHEDTGMTPSQYRKAFRGV